MPTGIITDSERAFLRGENEVEDPEGYERNLRHRARKRIERIARDLEILEEHGEDELVEKFYAETDREGRLEERIERLEQLLDEKHGE